MKRKFAFTVMPTIFEDVVLQIPPRRIEPNLDTPQTDLSQSVDQPVFGSALTTSSGLPPQEWVEQHVPCLDVYNSLETRINDARAQLGEMQREV